MMDFRSAKSVVIPEGEVSVITCGADILWQKQLKKYKTKLAYIETTGTQIINTDYSTNQDSVLVLDFQATVTGDNNITGGRLTTTRRAFTFGVSDNSTWEFGYNTSTADTGVKADTERHTVQLNKNICIVDGTVIREAKYASFEAGYAPRIGGIKGSSKHYYGYVRIYSFRLYANGTLVRDLVPVLDWDDVPCMYDEVSDKLFYNAGTGEFLYGLEDVA